MTRTENKKKWTLKGGRGERERERLLIPWLINFVPAAVAGEM